MGGCPLGKFLLVPPLPKTRIKYRVRPESARPISEKPLVPRPTLPIGQSIHLQSSITQQQLLFNADCILNSYMFDRISSGHVVRDVKFLNVPDTIRILKQLD